MVRQRGLELGLSNSRKSDSRYTTGEPTVEVCEIAWLYRIT